ncbi:iron-siderophore ABC transporter substrate-binding protein [Kutzneria viridogrisea]|uniref:Iron complex transport system substrate-binding protein n=1 Tax=Kutzneria viridogrisea TaxID=47990 RepID=A0ABR6BH46_9PSEU|nr:iron complex transport system substrate-binding protein [Kutzneria viridogrisea]
MKRIILAMTAAALLVGATACGQAATDAKSEVAQGGSAFQSAGERTAKYGTDALPGQFPRTIKHAMGETTLKAKPERVVVLDVGELDNVVALGVQPVGVAYTEGSPTMPGYIGAKGGTPTSVGTINSLNLETIAKLKPDLILGSKLRAEKSYEKLSKIAPTVFSERPGYTWKANFLLNSAALDRTDQADKLLADYQSEAKAVGEAVQAKLGRKPTISPLRFMPNMTRVYARKSFIGTILADTGLPTNASGQVDDLAVQVGAEQIDRADADWIFVGSYGDPSKTQQNSFQTNPLWQTLGAVKAGHAKTVADETWYLGLGVLAANQVLTELRAQLTS